MLKWMVKFYMVSNWTELQNCLLLHSFAGSRLAQPGPDTNVHLLSSPNLLSQFPPASKTGPNRSKSWSEGPPRKQWYTLSEATLSKYGLSWKQNLTKEDYYLSKASSYSFTAFFTVSSSWLCLASCTCLVSLRSCSVCRVAMSSSLR